MEGCKFVAGETLTYVDFMFWEILDHMYRFGTAFIITKIFIKRVSQRFSTRMFIYESLKDDSMFADFKNLLAFKANFEALPNVAAYIKSDRFMAGPCNNKMAKWGGDAELKRSW